jgi:lysophospholipase L1-like esterase
LAGRQPEVTGLLAAIVCFCVLIIVVIGERTVSTAALQEAESTDRQIRSLSTQKVFFGHQSVGDNIIQGIREITAADSSRKLNIIESTNPEAVDGPVFVEGHVGQNTDPQSKNADFLAIMNQGFTGIAMFKYCYIDIGETTDVQQMFNAYRATIEEVRRKNPRVRIVHATVPLTTLGSATKAWLKSMLGKNTAQDDNIKRNRFNTLLLQTYAADPIFDIATVESTRGDGSRSYFKNGNEFVYTLAPEYTSDGGHLNHAGRRVAAERLLQVLANLQ